MHEAAQGNPERDAKAAQATERARLQAMAGAYLDGAAIGAPQASPREIRKFYEENPALFEHRRIYRILELMVVVAPEQIGALQNVVAEAKNIETVIRWIDTRNLPYEAALTSKTADRIPMNVLRRLYQMRDGQIAIFPMPGGASVLRLVQSSEIPVSEKQARAQIARYLLNRNRIDVAESAAAKLREQARPARDDADKIRTTAATQIAVQGQSGIASTGMQRSAIDFARPR